VPANPRVSLSADDKEALSVQRANPEPVPGSSFDCHLHYYRYQVGGEWTEWEPDETLARWDRLPRRLPDDDSARPVWFALRDANAQGLVSMPGGGLGPRTNFGLRLTVHATNRGPRNAISYSEKLVDGTIAAFHNDRYSGVLLSVLAPKLPGVTDEELRRALDHPVGPSSRPQPSSTRRPASFRSAQLTNVAARGELTIRQDSTSKWPELSGELFTVRPVDSTDHRLGRNWSLR
jgi:hypothetical protein